MESNKQLRTYLDSLPDGKRKIASLQIRESCMISYAKFYRWLNGAKIDPLYQKTIEEAIGEKIFN